MNHVCDVLQGKLSVVEVTGVELIPMACPGDFLLIDSETGRVRAVVKVLGDDDCQAVSTGAKKTDAG